MESDDGTFDSRRAARLDVGETIAERILKNDDIMKALDANEAETNYSDKLPSKGVQDLLDQKRGNESAGSTVASKIEDMIHHYCYHILVTEGLLTRE